jgi:peptide/nickel transport system permease protein
LGLKRYVATRMITMCGVLFATLILTIALVGSNMDTILKQSVVFQVRSEIAENPALADR